MSLQYRRPIVITNSDAAEYTDYPVLVSLDYPTDYVGKVDANMYGLRFTDSGGNPIPHWIVPESRALSTTRIFVKVPTVTASADTTIYMYYGDTGLSSIETGTGVWKYYEPFVGTDEALLTDSGWVAWYDQGTGDWRFDTSLGFDSAYINFQGAAGPLYNIVYNLAAPSFRRSDGIQIISCGNHGTPVDWYDDFWSTVGIVNAGLTAQLSGGFCATGHVDGVNAKQEFGLNGSTIARTTGNYDWTKDVFYVNRMCIDSTNAWLYYYFKTDAATNLTSAEAAPASGDWCKPILLKGQTWATATRSSFKYMAYGQWKAGVSAGAVGAEENLGPFITSISPAYGTPGTTVTGLDIVGENFVTGDTIEIQKTGELDVAFSNVIVNSGTSITADLVLPPGTPVGWWDLAIVSP